MLIVKIGGSQTDLQWIAALHWREVAMEIDDDVEGRKKTTCKWKLSRGVGKETGMTIKFIAASLLLLEIRYPD